MLKKAVTPPAKPKYLKVYFGESGNPKLTGWSYMEVRAEHKGLPPNRRGPKGTYQKKLPAVDVTYYEGVYIDLSALPLHLFAAFVTVDVVTYYNTPKVFKRRILNTLELEIN